MISTQGILGNTVNLTLWFIYDRRIKTAN